jgi:hypothetical protein
VLPRGVKQKDASAAAVQSIPRPAPGQVTMRSLQDSELAIGIYPKFTYDAAGGGGVASAKDVGNGRVEVSFDLTRLNIPDVYSRTAKFMGVPLLPPFKIRIQPTRLEGYVDRSTGMVELDFEARFMFTAGKLYKAPPLLVTTHLTSEEVQGKIRTGQGSRLDEHGFARLVGVATVPKTQDWALDKFLMLPTETYAVMSSQFLFDA